MAGGVPPVFTTTGERLLGSYNYVDIATGLGVVVYYGATYGVSDGTHAYFLTDQSNIYSSSIETRYTAAGTTTHNFDTSVFNSTRTAKGTAYVQIGIEYTTTARLDFTIQKVGTDGSTVTNISSVVSTYTYSGGANTAVILLYPIALTKTDIKTGEKLRLKVQMVQDVHADGFTMAHDPQNRDGSEITPSSSPSNNLTQMKLLMPFVINNS